MSGDGDTSTSIQQQHQQGSLSDDEEDNLSVTLCSSSQQQPQQPGQQQQQQHSGGILSPLSLESANFYHELGGVGVFGGGDSSSFGSCSDDRGGNGGGGASFGHPTPLAFRAPWATPPKAPSESNKLSVTSPPLLPPFTVATVVTAGGSGSASLGAAPPARNTSAASNNGGGGVESICVRVGDALQFHQRQQQHPNSARSPESDFELHDLGRESFTSTPPTPPLKWDTARYYTQ